MNKPREPGHEADDSSDFARSMGIATSRSARAQAGRMRVISENLANADSTAASAGGDPYRRKVPSFSSALDRTLDAKVVALGKVRSDQSAFRVKYEPEQSGGGSRRQRVKYPNVNPLVEMTAGHARRPAILRGEPQRHQRVAPDDPAHPRHPQGLNRNF